VLKRQKEKGNRNKAVVLGRPTMAESNRHPIVNCGGIKRPRGRPHLKMYESELGATSLRVAEPTVAELTAEGK